MTGPSVAIVSLGCPKNLTDSEVMAGLAGQAGYILTPDLASAEAIVINTCAFIDPAREEAWAWIEKAAAFRRRGPCRALIVAGCLAQGFGEEVARRVPAVDRLLGTGEVDRVVAALDSALEGDGRTRDEGMGVSEEPAVTSPGFLPDAGTPRLVSTPPHYAYLKIAEGCGHHCAFCLIPALRGGYRSRPPEDVVREARALRRMGVKELVLVAQDTTAYGRDLAGRSLLADLSRRILGETGIEWLRVLYGHPSTLTADFLDLLAEQATVGPDSGRLCRYLDLPMQHASDRVLRAMRRAQTGESLLDLIERLRRRIPHLTLRSSFIIGFPGESDTDFQTLLDFLAVARLEHAGFFAFSREEGTRAAELPGQVAKPVVRERLARVASAQRRLALQYRRRLVGRRLTVMVDGRGGAAGPPNSNARPPYIGGVRSRLPTVLARTEGDAPEIDGRVRISFPAGRSLPQAGDFVTVEIVGARPYDLDARPLT